MAFTPFDFTKSWRNAADFPTFEPDETKVRDDLQSLFDELKAGLNKLIGELRADKLPFVPTAGVDSTDVQNAIENVQSQIANVALGNLPDGSVTERKLSDGSVTAEKIAAGAVTGGKIAEGVIPAPTAETPRMNGTAAAGEDAGYARGDHVHPQDSGKADLLGGKVLPAQLSRARVNVVSPRSLELSDDGKALYVSGAEDISLTVPANSSAQLPIGSEITVCRAGAGRVGFIAAEGVTLLCSEESLDGMKRYDSAQLKKWEANVWSVEFNHDFTVESKSITADKLADGAVGAAQLAADAVTGDKIAAGAVTGRYPVTISSAAASWARWNGGGDNAWYTEITVSGVRSSDRGDLFLQRGIASDAAPSLAGFEQDAENFAHIVAVNITADDTLRVFADEIPANDIYCFLRVVKK